MAALTSLQDARRTSVLLIAGEYSLTAAVVRCLSERRDVVVNVLSRNLAQNCRGNKCAAESESSRVVSRCASAPFALSTSGRDPIRYSRHVKAFFHSEWTSDDDLEAALREAIKVTASEVVLPCSITSTEFAVRRQSRIPGLGAMQLPALESFRTANDKWLFYEAARACGVTAPRTWRADDRSVLENAVFPVLLKPRLGQGGEGIVRIESRSDLVKSPEFDNSNYLIQEFVEGFDMGINVYCVRGDVRAHTVQKNKRAKSKGFAPGVNFRFGQHPEAIRQASLLMRHLDWNGVANLDMRVRRSDGAVVMLEMNPRFWGSIHGSYRAGVDFVGLSCGLANPAVRPAPVNYYHTYRALPHWLLGQPSDFGCRACDPLPDIARLLSALRRA